MKSWFVFKFFRWGLLAVDFFVTTSNGSLHKLLDPLVIYMVLISIYYFFVQGLA